MLNGDDLALQAEDKSSRVLQDEGKVNEKTLEDHDNLAEETNNQLDIDVNAGSNLDTSA